MKNKKLVIASMVFVLIVGAMLGLWLSSRQDTTQGIKTVTVSVVHGDGTEKNISYETTAEYLGTLILEEKLAEGKEGPYGLEISTVDGELADWNTNKSYWALYIGEDYATTGADGVVLTDGGVYRLVYTIG